MPPHTAATPILAIGAGDARANCIFEPTGLFSPDQPPYYDCTVTGAALALEDGPRGLEWVVGMPQEGDLLYATPAVGRLPPEGRWIAPSFGTAPAPVLLALTPGRCVARTLLASLSESVAAHLQAAEAASEARQPDRAADAYRAAHKLAALRCAEDGAVKSGPLPPALAVVEQGHTHVGLGQVLRGSMAAGSAELAIAAFTIAVNRLRKSSPRNRPMLYHASLLLAHTHMSINTMHHTLRAARAFRFVAMHAGGGDALALPASAGEGRALLRLARSQWLALGLRMRNHTLDAAATAFTRLLAALSLQGVAVTARRTDVATTHPPLWWADAICGKGNALQWLAANSQQTQLAEMTGASAGSALLTRAARATYEHGVQIGLWHSAWQRWNVRPPPHAPVVPRSSGWIDRSDHGLYPHATAWLLETHWEAIRDEATRLSGLAEPTGYVGEASSRGADVDEEHEDLLHRGHWKLMRFLSPAHAGWAANATRAAPFTARLLKRVPALRECASAPHCIEMTAQFSALGAGSLIAPHFGRGRLTLMLPLVAPQGCCKLQVGPETRSLEEGRVLVFDDSWEHQAWTDAHRVVLIVDVRHPSASVA